MDDAFQPRRDGYITKRSLNPEEKLACFHLRVEVFRRELQWTGNSCDEIDTDCFDRDATHIAALTSQRKVVGTLRVIGPTYPWMLETHFPTLIPKDTPLHNSDACEISRLAVARVERARSIARGITVADLLYRELFLHCRDKGIRYGYMIVSRSALKHFRARRLPCEQIGAFTCMPDGVVAVLVRLDWVTFLKQIRRSYPMLLRWYLQENPETLP